MYKLRKMFYQLTLMRIVLLYLIEIYFLYMQYSILSREEAMIFTFWKTSD